MNQPVDPDDVILREALQAFEKSDTATPVVATSSGLAERYREEAARLREALERSRRTESDLQAQLATLRSRDDGAYADLLRTSAELAESQARLADAENQIHSLLRTLADREDEIADRTARIRDLEEKPGEVAARERTLADRDAEVVELQEMLIAAEQRHASQVAQILAELDALRPS